MKPMRITIADDHQIIRVGLRSMLAAQPDLEVVGEAGTIHSSLSMIEREQPDVAILDLNMPDGFGLDVLPRIRAASPNTKVLILTMHSEQDTVRRSLAVGVHGFLNKIAEPEEVVNAVRTVAAGRFFVSVPMEVVGRGGKAPTVMSPPQSSRPLSERERQVLELFARGLTHREISEQMGVRLKTVETYRSRLGDKLGARTRQELVEHARAMGLVATAPSPRPTPRPRS
jgi:two-component system response regulator NreC